MALLMAAAAVLATAVPASARPSCELDPTACPAPPPPKPPAATDKAPTGAVDGSREENGLLTIFGYAADANGGPVTVDFRLDGALVASKPANLYNTWPIGFIGYSHSVAIPPVGPRHELCATARNVRDGSTPTAADKALGCVTSRPAAPTNLVVTASPGGDLDNVALTWDDNAIGESGYAVELYFGYPVYDDRGHVIGIQTYRASRAVSAHEGTGRMSCVLSGVSRHMTIGLTVRTVDGLRFSDPVSASFFTP